MSKVIIQPAGSPEHLRRYADTVSQPVPTAAIIPYTPRDVSDYLLAQYGDEGASVWGVSAGTNEASARSWSRISAGDTVLFLKDGFITSAGVVTMKFQSTDFALEIWGANEDGTVCELVYLLEAVRPVNLPVEILHAVGKGIPELFSQGFGVLGSEMSERILATIRMFGDEDRIVDRAAFEAAVERYYKASAGADQNLEAFLQLEQDYHLGRLLDGRKTGECVICGETYPRDLLIAAHIKKRGMCTREERLDDAVVMLNCRLGCHALFQEGYVIVHRGIVRRNPRKSAAEASIDVVSHVLDRQCTGWAPKAERYFLWHRKLHVGERMRPPGEGSGSGSGSRSGSGAASRAPEARASGTHSSGARPASDPGRRVSGGPSAKRSAPRA